jgi:hypothetical protein
MNGIGDIKLKQSKPGSESQKLHVFYGIWKIDTKDKCIHKNKHDHMYNYW